MLRKYFSHSFPAAWALVAVTALIGISGPAAQAAVYTWDSDGTWNNGATDGTGSWNTSASWYLSTSAGSADIPWTNLNTDTAQFGSGNGGSTAYTVTLAQATTANGLIFQNQAYTLSGSTLTLAGTTPAITVNASGGTIGSTLAGTVGLTKAGTGGLTLSGINIYTGNTTISAGSLAISGVLGNGTYAGTIANSGALLFNGSSNQALSAVISGVGSLTMAGGGVLTLGTNETYTGSTTVSSGTLLVNGTNSGSTAGIAKSSGLTINNGGTVTSGGTDNGIGLTSTIPVTINAGGLLTAVGTVTNHIGGVVTLAGGTLGSAASISGDAVSYGVWNLDGSVTAGGIATTSVISALNMALTHSSGGGTVFTVNPGATNGIDLDVTGYFGQPASVTNYGLIKAGNGVMRLSGVDTFTGGTTISGGTLLLGNAGGLQASTLAYNNYGGVLSFGTLTGGTLGGLSGSQSLTLQNAASAAVALAVGANTSSYTGGLGGLGSLTKIGAGTFTLGGTNTYSGGTTVAAGILEVPTTAALPGYSTAGQVFATGGVLAVNVGGAGQWNSSVDDIAALLAANGANFTSASALGIDTTNASGPFTYATSIGGAQGLTKLGVNTLILAGNNTYTGTTTVSAGTLKLAAATGSLASGGNLTTAAATVFDSNSNSSTFALVTNGGTITNSSATADTVTIGNGSTGAGAWTGAMNVIWNQGATSTSLTGAWSNTGTITLNANGAGTITLSTGAVNNVGTITNSGSGAGSATLSGIIGTNVTGVVENSTTSALALNGANTFTGGLTVQSGTVSTTAAAGFGAGSIKLGDVTGSRNALLLSTASGLTHTNPITVQAGSTGLLAIEGQTNSQTFSGPIILNNALTVANLTAAKTTTFSGVISGGSGLTVGSGNLGTVILSGTNTYAGGTTLNAGELAVASTAALPGYAIPGELFANGGMLAVNVGGAGQWNTTNDDIGALLAANGGNFSSTSTLGIDTTNASGPFTYATSIGGPQGLTKLGVNTLILSGTSTYTGTTTVSAGTLKLAAATGSIAGGGNLTTATGTLFDINNNAQTFGLVTNGGTITNSNAAANTVTIGNGSTGAGTWTGALNVIWNQAASSTSLTGAWSNAGNITLNANGAGTITLSTGTVNNVGTIMNSGGGTATTTISSVIGANVTGVVQNSATSPLTLSGANTYPGGTTVNSGTLSFSSIANVGAASSALGAPTTVANGTINVAGTLIYTGAASSSNRVINLTGNSNLYDSGSGLLTLSGGITGSGSLLIRGAQGITESGPLTFSGPLTKTDASVLTLSNPANSFGNVAVSTGTLTVNSIAIGGVDSALGAGTSITLGQSGFNNTGYLQFTGPSGGSSDRAIIIQSTSGDTNGGIIENTVSGQTLTLSGGVSTGGTGVTPSLQLIGAGNGIMSGNITGTGLTITKAGTGMWSLAGSNSYTGLTTVSAGTLQLGAVGGIASGNNLTTAAAGLFDINGNAQTLGLVTNGGTITNSNATAATVTIGNGSTGAGVWTGAMNVVWNQGATSSTLSGAWSNTGSITNSGSGVGTATLSGIIGPNVTGVVEDSTTSILALTGANTFTSGLTVQSGTASTTVATGFGAGSITLGDVAGSNNAVLLTTLSAGTIGNAITAQAGSSGILAIEGQTNSQTFTGAITLNNNATLANLTAAKTTTFAGPISGGSALSIGNTGIINAGSVVLTGTNTFAGALNLNSGILNFSSLYNLGGGTAAINFNGGTLQYATGDSYDISAGAVALNASGGTIDTGSNNVTLANSIGAGGTGGLTKVGAGTLTLSASDSYAGGTTLAAGGLVINNANALGTGPFAISAGTIDAAAGPITLPNNPLAWKGSFTFLGSNNLNLGIGNVSLTAAPTVTVAANTLTVGGNISGAYGLTKTGTGTLTLAGSNSYTGSTIVNGGVVNVTGSVYHTGNDFVFAYSAAGNSVVNVTGSVTSHYLYAGNISGGVGVLNLSGGTISPSGGDNEYTCTFGTALGGYGELNMTSGVVNTTRFQFGGQSAGTGGTGIGLISGGIVNNSTYLILARIGTSTGGLTITGGTINRVGAVDTLALGWQGTGRAELNVAGGLIDNSGQSVSYGAGTWTGTGIVNLNAGILKTNSFTATSGTSYLNFNGGTVRSNLSSTTFLPALTAVNVNGPFGSYAGGATIDTNGFNDTVAANLLAPAGNGIATLPVASQGSGYVGAPYVSITGAGSGATAIANMVDDGTGNGTFKVGSITITNPGVNYTGTPTFTLSGGGPTTAATPGTVTTAANTSGGLTKIGLGTLTLSGTNTYTGGTTISGGILTVASTAALPNFASGAVSVASGAALAVGGSSWISGNIDSLLGNANVVFQPGAIFGIDTTSGNFTYGSNITSNFGFVKLGVNTLTLSGSNSYGGGTTVAAGTLAVATAAALPNYASAGAVTVAAGATLDVLSGDGTSGWNSTEIDGLLGPGPGGATFAGNTAAFAVDTSNSDLNYATNITKNIALTKLGNGTLTLSGSNAYTGTTTLTAGTLTAASDSALGVGVGVLLNPSSGTAVLNFTSASPAIGSLANSGAGTSIIVLGNVSAPSATTLTVGGNNASTVFSGSINDLSGSNPAAIGSLVKIGTGSLALTTAANNYTGGTTISGGTLSLGNGANETGSSGTVSSLGTGPILITGGAMLAGAPGSTGNAYTITNSVTISGGAFWAEDGHQHIQTLTIGSGGATFYTTYSGKDVYLDGPISGSGAITVDTLVSAAGGVHFAGAANTFSGTVTVNPNGYMYDDSNTALQNATVVMNGTRGMGLTTTAPVFASLSGSGALTLGSAALTVDGNGVTSTFSGVLSGAGSLVKAGSGLMMLSGSNTYTGTTTITGGTLQLLNAAALQSSTLNYNGSGGGVSFATLSGATLGGLSGSQSLALQNDAGAPLALAVGANGSTTNYSGTLSGPGSLSMIAPGTLILSGTNTFTGGTTVASGILEVKTTATLPGTVFVANGAVFGVSVGTAGSGEWNSGGNDDILALATSSVLSTTATWSPGSYLGIDTSDVSSGTFNYATNLNFPFGLAKLGGNTLVLSGTNSFTGGLQISAGTLVVNSLADSGPGANGSGDIMMVAGANTGVALQYLGTGATTTRRINMFGTTAGGDADVVSSGSGPLSIGGATISGSSTKTLELMGSNTGNNTVTGPISNGNGTLSLTKNGSGLWILAGSDSFTGTTAINGGTLQGGNAAAFTSGGALSMSGSGVLDLHGDNALFSNPSASAVTNIITDNSSTSGVSVLTFNNQSSTLSALVADGATRSVAVDIANANVGSGAFALTSANTFSGGVTLLNNATGTRLVIGGAVSTVGSAGAIVSSPFGTGPITIGQTATDKAGIYVTVANVAVANAIVFNTALGTDRPGIRYDATGGTLSGTITANLAPATFSTNGTGGVTLTGQVTGTYGLALDNSYGTTITVTLDNTTANPNNYQGDTNIEGSKGVLVLGAANQIPNGVGAGNLIDNGLFNMAGFSETINALSGTGTVDGMSGVPTLTVGGNNATSTFSGILQDTAGALSLVKIGSGTLTLSGSLNSYSGGTSINGGTLLLGNAAALQNSTLDYNGYGGVLSFGTLTAGTLGGLSGSQSLTLQNTASAAVALAVGANGASTSYSGTLGGSGSLTKIGAGTLVLNGVNTYSGRTTVTAGILEFPATTALPGYGTAGRVFATGGVLAVNVGGAGQWNASVDDIATLLAANGANFSAASALGIDTSNASGPFSYGTSIGGPQGLYKLGSGTLSLTASSSYTGGTTVIAGELQLSAGSNTLSTVGGIAVVGGTLDLGGLGQSTSGAISFQGGTVQNGTLTESGTNTFNVQSGIISAALAGSVGLNKTTAGILVLSGTNTYTGGTTVAAGILTFASTAANPAIGAVNVAAGASLGLGVGGPGYYSSANVDSLFANTLNGVSMNAASGVGIDTSTGNFTYATSQSGARSLTKLGANILTLSSSNTYTGDTVVAGGTLTLGSALSLQNSRLNYNNQGGVLSFGTLASATLGSLTGAQNLDLDNTTPAAVALTVGNNGGSDTYSGILSGSGSLTKVGSGTLTLTGSSTFTGAVNLNAGIVNFASGASLGSGTAVSFNGGTLQYATGNTDGLASRTITVGGSGGTIDLGSNSSVTVASTLSGSGQLNKNSGGNLIYAGTSTGFTGTVSLTGGTFTVASNGSLTGVGSLTKAGNATEYWNVNGTLSAANFYGSYVGGNYSSNYIYLNVNAGGTATFGNMYLAKGAYCNYSTSLTAVNVYGTLNASSITGWNNDSGANLNTYDRYINIYPGGLLNATTINLSNAGGSGTFNRQLNLSGGTMANIAGTNLTADSTTSVALAGTSTLAVSSTNSMTINGVTSGAGGLLKTGPGTLNLANTANGYSGSTTVNGGLLKFSGGTLSATAPVVFTGAGTLDVNGTSQSIGSLTGVAGSQFLISNATLTTGGDNTNTAFAGVISGTGSTSLVKTGGGAFTLSGANTYAGPTIITGGTLQLGAGGTSGSIDASSGVTNNGVLAFNRSDNPTFALAVSGTGGLNTLGTGVLTLSGTSTYSGPTGVSAGTLAVNGSLGNTAVNVAAGATLAGIGSIAGPVTVADQGTINLVDNTIGTLTLTSAGTALTLGTGAGTVALDFELSSTTADQLALSSRFLSLNDVVTINLAQLAGSTISAGTYNLVSFGGLTGAGSFVLAPIAGLPNTLVASLNTTTNAEQLIIAPGVPAIAYWSGSVGTSWSNMGNWSPSPSGSGSISGLPGSISNVYFTAAGGTNLATTLDNNFTVGSLTFTASSSAVTINGTNTLTISTSAANSIGISDQAAAAQTISANVALGTPQTWTVAGANPLTVGGVISGASTAGLTLAGTGTVVLTAANTYTGGTTVNGATLQLGDGASHNGSVAGNIADNGLLNFANPAAQTYGGTIGGSGAVLANGPGLLTFTAAHSYTGGTTIGANAALQLGDGSLNNGSVTGNVSDNGILAFANPLAQSMSGTISGAGGVTKTAAGTLTLASGANSYAGGTTVSGGTLDYGVANALPTTGAVLVNGGQLNLNGQGPSAVGAVTLASGSITGQSGDTLSGSSFNVQNGTVGVALAGPAAGLVKTGLGAVVLSATSSYGGGTTVGGGLLQYGTPNALPATGAVLVDGGQLDLNGQGSSSVGAVTLVGGSITGQSNDTLVARSVNVQSGAISVNLGNSGGTPLVKSGAGTVTLSGTNSYAGGTSVEGGVLSIGVAANLGTGALTLGAGTLQTTGNVVLDTAHSVTLSSAAAGIDVPNLTDTTLNGLVTGPGGLNKTGAGTLALANTSGDNYSGDTNVLAGTLLAAADNALSPNSKLVIGDGASVILDFGGGAVGDALPGFLNATPSLAAPSLAAPSLAAPALSPAGISTVPEPGTLLLLVAGALAGLIVWRRRGR